MKFALMRTRINSSHAVADKSDFIRARMKRAQRREAKLCRK